MEKKYIDGQLKLKDNIVSVIASSDTKDRDGDVINPQGWELERFKQNPVILWAHNPTLLPIGKATDVFVQDNKLIMDIAFADHDFAREVEKAVKDGFLNTTSVGFMPTGEKGDTQELIELSFVSVPSNPDAQVLRSKGFEAKAKAFEAEKEKSGRIISEKNRNIMRIARDAMKASIDEVTKLLEISEPKIITEPDKKGVINKLKKVSKKPSKGLQIAKLQVKIAEAMLAEQKDKGVKKK